MPDDRGIVDTSIVVGWASIDRSALPDHLAITAITIAELAAGPHATDDPHERAIRQDRLQRIESAFVPLPFDANAARAYGRMYAAARSSGRKPRGRRAVDLLIAATAASVALPLYTRNAANFRGLESIVRVIEVP